MTFSWLAIALSTSLLLAALVVLAIRRRGWLIGGTLLLLLVHEIILRWLRNGAGLDEPLLLSISVWKDAALLALLLGVLIDLWQSRGIDEPFGGWTSADSGAAAFGILVLLGVGISPNRTAALAAARDYLFPMILYLVGRTYTPSREWTRRLLSGWLALGGLMAILGIWQGLFWTENDYLAFGFGQPSGQIGIPGGGLLGSGRRPPSTLTSSNELALHMVLLSAAGLQLLLRGNLARRSFWSLVVVLFLSALLLTRSRSGFLAALVAAILALVHRLRGVEGARRLAREWRRGGLFLGVVAAVLIALGLVTGFFDLILGTVQRLGDQYHIRDTADAIVFLVHQPAGVGLGLVGPRQGLGIPTVFSAHVEGSIFQIAMEMGVWGLAVFLAFVGIALRAVWRAWERAIDPVVQVVCGTAVAGWAGALVALTFLPLMQALPLMGWLWFFLGLGVGAIRLEERWGSAMVLPDGPASTGPPRRI